MWLSKMEPCLGVLAQLSWCVPVTGSSVPPIDTREDPRGLPELVSSGLLCKQGALLCSVLSSSYRLKRRERCLSQCLWLTSCWDAAEAEHFLLCRRLSTIPDINREPQGNRGIPGSHPHSNWFHTIKASSFNIWWRYWWLGYILLNFFLMCSLCLSQGFIAVKRHNDHHNSYKEKHLTGTGSEV